MKCHFKFTTNKLIVLLTWARKALFYLDHQVIIPILRLVGEEHSSRCCKCRHRAFKVIHQVFEFVASQRGSCMQITDRDTIDEFGNCSILTKINDNIEVQTCGSSRSLIPGTASKLGTFRSELASTLTNRPLSWARQLIQS